VARGSGGEKARQRNHLVLIVVVLAAIGVLAAAGSGLESGDDTSGAPGGPGAGRSERTLSIAFASRPRSLDPAFAVDRTSATLVLALMEPLVRLGPKLEVEPALARRWGVSEDGRRITFTLRPDRIWTNGEPVTARDVEFAWKRVLSSSTDSPLAGPLLALRGAAAYRACTFACGRLEEAVGVRAAGAQTLVVTLARPEPWFLRSAGLPQLVPVSREAILREGREWTEPGRIVTNGPFVLGGMNENGVSLVRNARFRPPGAARAARVEGRFVADAAARVQAFDAGRVDALDGSPLPKTDLVALQERREYEAYPGLETHLYAFNFTTVSDVHQRRAMALAIDRRTIIDNIAQADQLPTTGFTPEGMPGFETLNPSSPWLPETGDIEQAKELMGQVQDPVRNVTLLLNDSPGHREIAVAVQSMWKELGITTEIRQQEWAQFLEFIGPPPDASIDSFRLGWIGDYVDAMNFLELWTCDSGNNSTNYCDPAYDELVSEARQTPDNDERYGIYAELEQKLFGEDGAVPVAPIYWYTYVQLEKESIKDSLEVNLLSQTDYTKVVETDGSGDA